MTALISEGRPAPAFCLPGVNGARARLYRLRDCVADGPVLLAFVPGAGGPCSPTAVADALSWFALIDGVTALVVADDHYTVHRREGSHRTGAAPILGDEDASVGAVYGVRYGEGGVAVYLVDGSRTVRGRWRAPDFDGLDLTALKDAAKRTATPATETHP
ncbi:MAG: redoxin domain-containing protein [Halobacteriaceae archaeon]